MPLSMPAIQKVAGESDDIIGGNVKVKVCVHSFENVSVVMKAWAAHSQCLNPERSFMPEPVVDPIVAAIPAAADLIPSRILLMGSS